MCTYIRTYMHDAAPQMSYVYVRTYRETRHAGHVLIVPTLAPLVDQQWRWLRVGWLDPGRKEPSLVGLVPKVLVEVGISDLLQWLHVVHRHKVAVQVHELNAALEEARRGGERGWEAEDLARMATCQSSGGFSGGSGVKGWFSKKPHLLPEEGQCI